MKKSIFDITEKECVEMLEKANERMVFFALIVNHMRL